MKAKIITIAATLFITVISSSQQIGNGQSSEITDFSAALGSGTYQGLSPIGMNPDISYSGWQHLFVVRHSNLANNHQLQLSSSYTENDRLFFRKKALSVNPAWIELATRGTNNFVGDQIINGNVGINTTPSFYQHGGNNRGIEVNNPSTTVNSQSHIILSTGSILPNSSLGTLTWSMPNMSASNKGLAYIGVISGTNSTSANPSSSMVFATRNATGSNWNPNMVLSDTGNLGIGILVPTNKLDVNGTIHSKEVKVDMLNWSDFVFKKEYELPTLAEVEKHIAEKGHLKNIPSEEEVLKNGINLGEMNAKLLQKIEEMTLYMIEQNKKINELEQQNKKLADLEKRLNKIESTLN